MSKSDYTKTLMKLRNENPGTEEYFAALENYQVSFWKTSGEILGRNYSLLEFMARKFGIPVDESIDVLQCLLYEKINYFIMEDAEDSYYQLAQKANWMLLDYYGKITNANKIKKSKKGIKSEAEKSEKKEEEKKGLFVSFLSFDTPLEDEDGMTYAEVIRDENADDPESVILLRQLCDYVVSVILANSNKVTNSQLLAYLNFLVGNDNEQLADLINTWDSREVMKKIKDSYTERFGYSSKQLADLNLDIPKSLSYKGAANRTSEAKRIINTILEADPLIDEYLRNYFLGKYRKSFK